MFHQSQITIHTTGRAIIEITAKIADLVNTSAIHSGICHLFLQHTSASLLICENADPSVRQDLETIFARLVPDNDASLTHTAEGGDDMSAHARTILTKSELSLPFASGKLLLGTWQGIFLWEHRKSAHTRKLMVTLLGG